VRLRPLRQKRDALTLNSQVIVSWAQPFPRTWMLRQSGDILEGPMGFRQPITTRRLFTDFETIRRMSLIPEWGSDFG
jgi:hypothetical protein